jgi:uncharacterized protein (DUF4415 family)
MRKPDPERVDKENPRWTDAMFAKAKPAAEVFPDLVASSERRKRGQRGLRKKPRKATVSLRIDQEVLAVYKAYGRGWQSRMNDALRRACSEYVNAENP